MSAEVVENWLQTGRNAVINQISVKPIEHKLLKGKPLSSQKGQAEAFFLIDDNGNWWILKKFHNTHNLDRSYLNRIASVLPREDGFTCGTKRQVLYRGVLQRTMGFHYDKDLDKWLDGTILMPRIAGFDWAAIADELRDGKISLDGSQRFTLCMNLTQLVQLLENCRCSHRDLSCGNVFVDPHNLQVYLIDFDSLFHPSLRMPSATTCGTTGYTAHHAWNNGNLDPRRTWCECADRYALALINVEFLLVSPGAKATGEGGIFDQDELKRQSGSGINSVIGQLRSEYPHAAQLLEAAIYSSTFSDCPSPQDWNDLFDGATGIISTPPSLDDLIHSQNALHAIQLVAAVSLFVLKRIAVGATLPRIATGSIKQQRQVASNNIQPQQMSSIDSPNRAIGRCLLSQYGLLKLLGHAFSNTLWHMLTIFH